MDFQEESLSSEEDSDTSFTNEKKRRKHHDHGGNEIKKVKTSKEKKKNQLYKQPTAEELTHLKETENLFNSNIFRLQIEELLAEVKIKPVKLTKFKGWFESFKKEVGKFPDDGEKCFKKVKGVDFLGEQDVSMVINKPSGVFTFGAYKCIKADYTPNIGVIIDNEAFVWRDCINNKYTLKKYRYINYLLHNLKKLMIIKDVVIEYFLDCKYLPVLKVTPDYSDGVRINIFVVPQVDVFKPSRFLPNKNNIKENTYTGLFGDVKVTEENRCSSTFLYNSILLHDCTLETNQKLINDSLEALTNVQDGIKLLIVWLKQRNLNDGLSGFTMDLLLYIILHLIKKKKLNKHMSSYQVVRIFWTFLSNVGGEVYCINEDTKGNSLELFTGKSVFTLLDATGCYNVAGFLNEDIFAKVKREAAIAIENLDGNSFNTFAALFTTKMPVEIQFDIVLKLFDDDNFGNIYKSCDDSLKFKYLGFYSLLIHDEIMKVLRIGLGDKVAQIIPLYCDDEKIIKFGITLNPERYSTVIIKGPKQYDPEAEDFKEFWGERAELRRFKDGTICEAVFFEEVKTIQDKRLIFKKIIDYIMSEKLNLNYTINGAELETVLHLDRFKFRSLQNSVEELTLNIKKLYTDLNKILRDLQLPLPITSVQGVSDLFSYTDLFPPYPMNYLATRKIQEQIGDVITIKESETLSKIPDLITPIECVIHLAVNSKWPKELDAFRAMKVIFLFEIAKLMRENHHIKSSVQDDYIDIYFKGVVFRIRLFYSKEIALLKKDVTSEGTTFYKDTEESLELQRNLELLPQIMGALNGVHQQYPAYGPSSCLIKRWLRSQLLDNHHISDTVINLLNASLFLQSNAFNASNLPQVAFIRFLKFMSEFDFNYQPVIVNFNNELKREELGEFETKFLQNRQSFNPVHIIMPYDQGNSLFTKHSPSINVLNRIKVLSTATYQSLLKDLQGPGLIKFKPFFKPNLDGYNILIHVNSNLNPRKHQSVENNEALKVFNYYTKLKDNLPVVDFNPVDCYLKELRDNYSETALFFHDFYGGNVIGVLWKEKALEKSDFKISTVNARKFTNGQLVLNKEAIIEDFHTLGKGLVKNITIQNA